jgi:hypothetical protein
MKSAAGGGDGMLLNIHQDVEYTDRLQNGEDVEWREKKFDGKF